MVLKRAERLVARLRPARKMHRVENVPCRHTDLCAYMSANLTSSIYPSIKVAVTSVCTVVTFFFKMVPKLNSIFELAKSLPSTAQQPVCSEKFHRIFRVKQGNAFSIVGDELATQYGMSETLVITESLRAWQQH